MAWVANRRGTGPDTLTGAAGWSECADALAVEHAAFPLRALRLLLALTVATLAVGLPLGVLVRGDAALWLREGMPGTWLSAAMILAAAVAARAIHRREPGAPRVLASFWGLSTAILLLLAVVELLQPTQFMAHWLADHTDAVVPFGLQNLDALLVILLLVGIAVVLAPRALVLRHHPRAFALLCIAGLAAVGCQAMDSALPGTTAAFVAEDGLKALGEPFLVAGYLMALRDHLSV